MLSVTPGPRGHSQPGPPRTRVTVRELIQHHRRQSCSQGEHYGKRAFPEEHNHSPPPDFLGCKRRPPVNAAWETAVNEPSSAAATPSGPGVPLIRHPYVVQGGWGPSSPPPPPRGVSDGEVSLFQWQVLKQSREMSHVTSEMLDVQDEDGDTYLHIAVAQGRRALAYVLAEKNRQSIDTKDRNGQSALQIAVLTNQHLIVQDLLQLGASVNTRDHWGRSPLHVCAERGHVLSLQTIHNTLLLGDGQPIEIDLFNYEGMTPLHVAVTSFNRLVRELRGLERGVCSLVAMELARRRRWYMDIVHTLLLTGAQCGTKDQKNGKTSLHLAVGGFHRHG
ncbi:hypothetical protein NHX12_015197 [Muraenolepis orangiensis]|uniref:Uncharacterized protein n=1 Tax=Muraenolepis orangiensis TaxID=630683 RepID=A0A9Q0DDJ6_9TELE|nr:hypothetical protein NHX12_015197 [Muraenolepis orangiensis]